MTRKELELIARVLRQAEDLSLTSRRNLAERFAQELPYHNPRFDKERFLGACIRHEDSPA